MEGRSLERSRVTQNKKPVPTLSLERYRRNGGRRYRLEKQRQQASIRSPFHGFLSREICLPACCRMFPTLCPEKLQH